MKRIDKTSMQKMIEEWAPLTQSTEIISIGEYINNVIETPKLASLAHARLYNMIASQGVAWEENEDGERKPTYNFFNDEIYGLEDTLENLVNIIDSGGRLLPIRKRVIMLMGPVGGGKSTIAAMLKKGTGSYSRTDEGAIFAIKDCPIHEDPLHALPLEMRNFLKENHDIYIEGELCPTCKYKLDNEFNGDFRKFEINRVYFGEQERKGVGTFAPSDVKSQDIAELIGSVNLSKIAEYGIESDPRAFTFDGELNISNRGMIELIEMLKCDPKFLYVFLTLAQENQIKVPKFPLVYEDIFILAHTNETEWKNFMSKPENEALKDRIVTILCPYVLKVSDEEKIYEKEWNNSADSQKVIIAPRTFNLCSMFSILSRLEEPKNQTVDLLKKMKAYNGEEVEGLKDAEIKKMKQDTQREGMFGIGPRYIMNCISKAATDAQIEFNNISEQEKQKMCYGLENMSSYKPSVDAIDMLRVFSDAIEEDPEIDGETKQKYQIFLETAREELDKKLQEDIQKAFCFEFEQEAEILFQNYLNNVIAYINSETIKDPITGKDMDADERFMQSVEEMINIGEGTKEQHRQTIVNRYSKAMQKNKHFDYKTHSDLKDAITKRIFESRKDTIQITTTSLHPDEEKIKELNRVIKRLCEQGYTPYSAAKIVRYVGKLLNR